ncbi:MAG: VanZ family protein [Bacillota bacterium]
MILVVLKGAMALLWMLVIFSFSQQGGSESADLSMGVMDTLLSVLRFFEPDIETLINVELFHSVLRTMAHFFLYFFFAFWVYDFLKCFFEDWFRLTTETALIALLVAILDESLQGQVPGRAMQISDIYTDFFGAIFGAVFMTVIFYKRKEVT